MVGTPIPGAQWVAVTLKEQSKVTRAVIDWETARADDYRLEFWSAQAGDGQGAWRLLPTRRVNRNESKSAHIVDDLECWTSEDIVEADQFRIFIERPARAWGASIWRFQLWGT